jgi:hypothetical protein
MASHSVDSFLDTCDNCMPTPNSPIDVLFSIAQTNNMLGTVYLRRSIL